MRDPRREFAFRPFAVGEPYGAARIFRYDMEALAARCGASFHADGIVSVEPGRRLATTRDGERLSYDYLLLATGVRMLWAVPGAVTFWGAADEGQVGDVVADLRAGALRSLAFTMPGGPSWALPLYELALFAASELAKSPGARTRLTVVTPEDAPAGALRPPRRRADGPAARGARGGGRRRRPPGRLRGRAAADRARRRDRGRRCDQPAPPGGSSGRGPPHDPDGFVGVDEHGKAIGAERVFAAGDVTAFPIKQGGIATQQADVAASLIACECGADVDPEPFDPVLRGVLWTGREPRYLYGRPTGGHGETSSLGERPQWPAQNGKVIGRYLTSFLDPLAGGGDRSGARRRLGRRPPDSGHDEAVSDALVQRFRAARRDRGLAVLEGFHALKHALRFGAEIVEAVAADPRSWIGSRQSWPPTWPARWPGATEPVERRGARAAGAPCAPNRCRRDRPPPGGRRGRGAGRPAARPGGPARGPAHDGQHGGLRAGGGGRRRGGGPHHRQQRPLAPRGAARRRRAALRSAGGRGRGAARGDSAR